MRQRPKSCKPGKQPPAYPFQSQQQCQKTLNKDTARRDSRPLPCCGAGLYAALPLLSNPLLGRIQARPPPYPPCTGAGLRVDKPLYGKHFAVAGGDGFMGLGGAASSKALL